MKKTVCIPEDEWQIIPNPQEAIIDEDNVLGKISDDRFYRMSANYEKEQKVREAEQEKINLNVFLTAIGECTD